MAQHESDQFGLPIVDRPSQAWWREGARGTVKTPPKWRARWTKEELREVLIHPEEPFEALAERLERTPGSINRMRCILLEAAGVVADLRGFEPEGSKRKQMAYAVLDEEGFATWSEEERQRFLSRGKGLRSDKTSRALNQVSEIRRMAAQLRREHKLGES